MRAPEFVDNSLWLAQAFGSSEQKSLMRGA
jgi:hypothetical protein